MKSRTLLIGSLLALATGAAHSAPTAQAILAASDAVRNPDKPFALTVTLI